MPDEFLLKVKYLCRTIAKVEWSGILFYSIVGSIKQPETFSIILQDILPMDRGTGAYTEYEIDNRYVDYLMDNPEAMEWHMGHIHSHNTMRVFFSGTDMSELNDNSENHNFYLSLIVNNFMDFACKIGFRAAIESKVTDVPYHALDEEGEKYIVDKATVSLKKEKLYVYDCLVVSKAEVIKVSKDFAGKVEGIVNPPKPLVEEVKKLPPAKNIQRYPNNFNPTNNKRPMHRTTTQKEVDDFNKGFALDEQSIEIELFAKRLLNFGVIPGEDVEVIDLIDGLEEMGVTAEIMASSVYDNIAKVYESQYPFQTENVEHFISTITEVGDVFEDYKDEYPFLYASIGLMREMIIKFEEYEFADN